MKEEEREKNEGRSYLFLTVDAPRWGVQTRLGWEMRALKCSLGGSEVYTSSAAPATLPDCIE